MHFEIILFVKKGPKIKTLQRSAVKLNRFENQHFVVKIRNFIGSQSKATKKTLKSSILHHEGSNQVFLSHQTWVDVVDNRVEMIWGFEESKIGTTRKKMFSFTTYYSWKLQARGAAKVSQNICSTDWTKRKVWSRPSFSSFRTTSQICITQVE